MDKNQLVGISETGDVAFNLEVFDNLYDANIIVTKRLTKPLVEKLIEHKAKCILHLTITGMGGTKLEPLVPSKETSRAMFDLLIRDGFPIEQVVLRVDPIIPTNKGITTAMEVIHLFRDSGIKRIRYSSFDMYEHVKERFTKEGIKLPYETFHADNNVLNSLNNVITSCGFMMDAVVEACGEPNIKSVPCISQRDIDTLGLTDSIILEGNAGQRSACGCPGNKKQLIKRKPTQCGHSCLYCFWKNE